MTLVTIFIDGETPLQFDVATERVQEFKKAVTALRKCFAVPYRRRGRGVSALPFANEVAARSGYGACKLAAKRFNAGMSLAFLAKATGMHPSHICAMESGKRPIGKIVAKRFAVAFGCDWREFVRL